MDGKKHVTIKRNTCDYVSLLSHKSLKFQYICVVTPLFVHNPCVLVILFHMVTKASFCLFNKLGPKPYSIGKVVHHIHYRGIQQEYTRVWHFLLYFCLINFGKKSCLFGKVTYVTALIWTYITCMIHKSNHHTPRTYIDSN